MENCDSLLLEKFLIMFMLNLGRRINTRSFMKRTSSRVNCHNNESPFLTYFKVVYLFESIVQTKIFGTKIVNEVKTEENKF